MSKKNLYAFVTSFVLLITVIILNYFSFYETKNYSDLVDHTRQVMTTFESISNDFKSAQIYTAGYTDTSERNFYSAYKKDVDNISVELVKLKKLISDNPVQVKLTDSLTAMIDAEMKVLSNKNILEIIQTGRPLHLDKILAIHQLINKGISHEETLLLERNKKLSRFTHLTNLLTLAFAIIAITVIIFVFLSNFFISKQRKWLEGFLESVLNTSQNGIVHYKAVREKTKIIDFKLEFVNKGIDRLLGIKSAEVIGKNLSELSSFVRETGLMGKYIEVVESGIPAEFEIYYNRNNNERWLLVSLAKLEDGLTASFHDISQLKKSEEDLKANIKELERSNTELEQYAYAASHDLQEPLRKIRSFGSFLQETQAGKLDEKGKQQLYKIITSAERMSMLIKDILAFSGLKKEQLFVPTDLNKILKAVLQDLDLMITQNQAIIETDTLPVIEAIPLQMNQLFYNLISNSLKFSKEGESLHLKISCKKLEENEKPEELLKHKTYFEIIFTDNGIGFNSGYAKQIFGLFKRLNDRQFYPGSGIGLALCKKVVENHKGEIIATGKENEGASFYVYLPEKQT